MKARLASWAAVAVQSRMQPDLLESSLKRVDGDRLRIPSNKEGSSGVPGGCITTTGVFGQRLNRLGSNRHQTSFKELRISDSKNSTGKIDIADRQTQCLICPQRRAIHQKKKRTHYRRIKITARSPARFCRIQHAPQFSRRIDVRLECWWPFRNGER